MDDKQAREIVEQQLIKSSLSAMVQEEVHKVVTSYMEEHVPNIVRREMCRVIDVPLTIKQVALISGRTEKSVRKMCERGTLPSTKTGGLRHINLQDLNDTFLFPKQRKK